MGSTLTWHIMFLGSVLVPLLSRTFSHKGPFRLGSQALRPRHFSRCTSLSNFTKWISWSFISVSHMRTYLFVGMILVTSHVSRVGSLFTMSLPSWKPPIAFEIFFSLRHWFSHLSLDLTSCLPLLAKESRSCIVAISLIDSIHWYTGFQLCSMAISLSP